MQGGNGLRNRDTVRLVLMNQHNCVLLIKIETELPRFPDIPESRVRWITPGGGVEPDETFEQALIREAWEEIGLRLEDTGTCVWTETPIWMIEDEPVHFNIRYYFVRINDHQVKPGLLTEEESDIFREFRWWSVDEMRNTKEFVFPPGMPDLIAPLTVGTIPDPPAIIVRPD